MNPKRNNPKTGALLLLAVIVIAVLGTLFASLAMLFDSAARTGERQVLDVQARLLAESLVEDCYWYIREDTLLTATDAGGNAVWTKTTVSSDVDKFTRSQTTTRPDNRIETIEVEMERELIPGTSANPRYTYEVDIDASILNPGGVKADEYFTVNIIELGTLPPLATPRLMDNARPQHQYDQVGMYNSLIDPITTKMLLSYDNWIAGDWLDLATSTPFSDLFSYEPLIPFVPDYGHTPAGSTFPYVNYMSRDLTADGGTSAQITVYYGRRSETENHPRSTLEPGDGKTFLDFVTGAGEAEAQAAAAAAGLTFEGLATANPDQQNIFLTEMAATRPDSNSYKFVETIGLAPQILPYTDHYSSSGYYGGVVRTNNLSLSNGSADPTPSNANPPSVRVGTFDFGTKSGQKMIEISGGSYANNVPVVLDLPKRRMGRGTKGIKVPAGSNVVLRLSSNDAYVMQYIEVEDGASLALHVGPEVQSLNVISHMGAMSGNPMDLQVYAESKEDTIVNPDSSVTTSYVAANMAFGDPYRAYQPYAALNLDNANHPTVATIFAPHSTVYTDHFAGVVIAEHYQTHGVLMIDKHTLENCPVLIQFIINSGDQFALEGWVRKKRADI